MPHGILEWDIDQLQHAMHLNVDDIRAYFTDGRRISFMLERRLMREVLGGRLAISAGASTTKIPRWRALELLQTVA
ncbi:MAG: hypothetical protein WBL39_10590 [Terrimicrobiaceae bacterium]